MRSHDLQELEPLIQRFRPDSTLLRVWELEGGVSAQVTALELRRPDGSTEKVLVLRHGAVDRARNPNIAADEFRLLQILQAVGLPAPRPIYVDQPEDGSIPALVIEFVEGSPEDAPVDEIACATELATQLAAIHSADYTGHDLAFLPHQTDFYAAKLRNRPERLDDALQEGRIRATLEAVWPLPQRNASTLLHGDFWPGNILWRDEKLAAIIDWEDAAVGDPLADLANSRLEVLWNLGLDALRAFTDCYRAAMPALDYAQLPYWDLCAALRPASKLTTWGLDDEEIAAMQADHRRFVDEAYTALASG